MANPLDYTAMIWGDGALLRELVRMVGEDPAIDQVLVFYDQFPGLTGAVSDASDAVREGIVAGAAASPATTMICSTLPELLDDDAAWRCVQSGMPAIAGLRTGLACAAALRAAPGNPARLREIARVGADVARGGEARLQRQLGVGDTVDRFARRGDGQRRQPGVGGVVGQMHVHIDQTGQHGLAA